MFSTKPLQQFLPQTYVQIATDGLLSQQKKFNTLLNSKRIPSQGFSNLEITCFLHTLSSMDSNNYPKKSGMGEREGRIFCPLVAQRHYYFAHGIGRSGDLSAVQPKAPGSTILVNLASSFASHALELSGLPKLSCFVFPTATGLTMEMAFKALLSQRSQKNILWSRIDQKTCLKSIIAANATPIVIPLLESDQGYTTNISAFKSYIIKNGPESVGLIVSTTSCFAPRIPDDVISLAKLAKQYNIPHVVNNAYGVSSRSISHKIATALNQGRVDAIIQSTDKNFGCPVGGAILATPHKKFLHQVTNIYPGRASAAPLLDFIMTCLHLGTKQLVQIFQDRKKLFETVIARLDSSSSPISRIKTKNPISIALKIPKEFSNIGSKLFLRQCFGMRTCIPGNTKTIAGLVFQNYGLHHDSCKIPYLTIAISPGSTLDEFELFFSRIVLLLSEFEKSVTESSTTSTTLSSTPSQHCS